MPGSWQFNLFIVLLTYKLAVWCAGVCNVMFIRQGRRFVDKDVSYHQGKMTEIVEQARVDAAGIENASGQSVSSDEEAVWKHRNKRRKRKPIVESPATSD